jgi:hypothetical protein
MFVEVHINNKYITNQNYIQKFNIICSFEEIKEDYINKLDLSNTFNNFDKSNLYFFVNDSVIKPYTKIVDVMEIITIRLHVMAL